MSALVGFPTSGRPAAWAIGQELIAKHSLVFVTFTMGMALAEAAWWVARLGVNHCVLSTQHGLVLLAFLLRRSFTFLGSEPLGNVGSLVLAFVPHNVCVAYTRVAQWFGTHVSSGTCTSSKVQRSILFANAFLSLCLFR